MEAKIFFGSQEFSKETKKETFNPYTKKLVSIYSDCDKQDVQKALLIADEAKKMAKKTPLHQRIEWLLDVAKNLENNSDDFAKTITDEVGKPIYFSKIEVARCIETIKLSAFAAASLHGETIPSDIMPSGRKSISYFCREPVGVVGAITPFNFPLNLIAHKLAPALVAGNSVVLKPTHEAPLIAYKLCRLFIESPYAIKDALSLVYGEAEVGSQIVKSPIPRVISFTGSVQVGKIITQNAGIKKIALELGGNAATYIDKTANLQEAAKKCAFGAFYNSGQVCISLQRIYAHKDIAEQFEKLLSVETEKLKVGNPYEEDVFVGPLIGEEAVLKAQDWVKNAQEAGAKVLCGNKIDGNIFYPTVMGGVNDGMKIVCEEVFAPIVSVLWVDDFDEALEKINSSPYGLQYSIFTNDLVLAKRAIEEYECGGVVVNDIPTIRFDVQPYGGVKFSGIGKEGPRFAIEEFTEIKSVVIL